MSWLRADFQGVRFEYVDLSHIYLLVCTVLPFHLRLQFPSLCFAVHLSRDSLNCIPHPCLFSLMADDLIFHLLISVKYVNQSLGIESNLCNLSNCKIKRL